MKNPKKPTYAQKQVMSKAGLNPKEYAVRESGPNYLVVIHKETNGIKMIEGKKVVQSMDLI